MCTRTPSTTVYFLNLLLKHFCGQPTITFLVLMQSFINFKMYITKQGLKNTFKDKF